ncbi:MAG: DNA primase, partial [Propionibacteriaceae bacterium]
MAPRILDEDIQTVRERARIEDVVGAFVALKTAGGGSLKGLCPFHDEKTPSFHVNPARGFYHCFGCGEGGDAIAFLQKLNNLSFAEAIEHLADRTGVQLRYTEETGLSQRAEPGLRQRVLEANRLAQEFYANALVSRPEAEPGRDMFAARGFKPQAAVHFGCGWAPQGGRELTRYLMGKGFSEAELIKASLTRTGGWDFFQGRVLWPIRDSAKQVIGFGARRILDDDRMPAKYINTMETP